MAGDLDALRGKVQRMLTEEFGTVEVDRDGDFTLRNGSARLFISCRLVNDAFSTVTLFCPLVFDVPKSPELFEYVAMDGAYRFGALTLHQHQEDPKAVNVYFGHSLLGDYLDAEELKAGVFGVLGTANDLDDEIQNKFGGRRFHEDG